MTIRFKNPFGLTTIPPRDVVTGAAGFIGSHLLDRLLEQGKEIIAIDNFDDYYARSQKESNVVRALENPQCEFIEGDLLNLDMSSFISPESRVFHLAAQPGVQGSWGLQFPRYLQNNVLATQKVLEACIRRRPSRLVYSSSSSVYGDQGSKSTKERVLPEPMSPYGVTKLAAEHLCSLYQTTYDLPVTILRFFSVYGPRQRPDMAFHRFIDAVQNNRPITVYGDGLQKRDFTFVDDIVGGILAAADTQARNGVFNLGGGSPASLLHVIEILEDISEGVIEVSHREQAKGEPRITNADSTLAREELGFSSKILLEEGLHRQWDWHLSHFSTKISR